MPEALSAPLLLLLVLQRQAIRQRYEEEERTAQLQFEEDCQLMLSQLQGEQKEKIRRLREEKVAAELASGWCLVKHLPNYLTLMSPTYMTTKCTRSQKSLLISAMVRHAHTGISAMDSAQNLASTFLDGCQKLFTSRKMVAIFFANIFEESNDTGVQFKLEGV